MIDDDQVRAIARLARITVDASETAAVGADLGRILGFIQQMNAIDTAAVAPLSHPLEPRAPLRPDVVTEENHREEFQAGAPAVEDGLYIVPKVID